jgi:hypothetical protein
MSKELAKQGWNNAQKLQWFSNVSQNQVRDYDVDVVQRVMQLPSNTHYYMQYGVVDLGQENPYPLLNVTVGDPYNGLPNILITGGVHGYEPSGVRACFQFLENEAIHLTRDFNFVVYPCLSPWSYEFDHRWNALAEDPNRNFSRASRIRQIDECVHFMNDIESQDVHFTAAVDLHETPDRDIQLRQERVSRFGTQLEKYWQAVPQGFYLMLSKPNQQQEVDTRMLFGRSIVNEVAKVSPIAPEAEVLGKTNHHGITISPPVEGTMRGYLDRHADHIGITEVYPDHASMSSRRAVDALLAAILGALKFVAR